MKVLILHPALTPYRVDLFNALAQQVDLTVIFLQKNATSQKFDTDELSSRCLFNYEWITEGFQFKGVYFRTGLFSKLRSIKPSIIVTHEFLGVSLQICLLKYFLSDLSHFIWSAENPDIHRNHSFIRKFIKRLFLISVDGLILYTHEIALVYRKYLSFKKPIALVPNIPNTLVFREMLQKSDSLASNLIKSNRWTSLKILLFVGRLAPEKSVDRLLRSWSKLHHRFPYTRVVIVGDGPQKAFLNDLASDLGISDSVLFFGRQEGLKLLALYRLATLLVLPSSYEPFGAVVNEALSAGIPVVCTNEVGAKVLINDSINGSVVNGSSELDLDSAISSWITKGETTSERMSEFPSSLLNIDFHSMLANLISTFQSTNN